MILPPQSYNRSPSLSGYNRFPPLRLGALPRFPYAIITLEMQLVTPPPLPGRNRIPPVPLVANAFPLCPLHRRNEVNLPPAGVRWAISLPLSATTFPLPAIGAQPRWMDDYWAFHLVLPQACIFPARVAQCNPWPFGALLKGVGMPVILQLSKIIT